MTGRKTKLDTTAVNHANKVYDANKGEMRNETARDVEEREQRSNRRRNRGVAEIADWSQANTDKLVAALRAVTSNGFAIRFGYTRDMGAFAIGIIGDGEPFTEYVRPTEDVDLYLDGLVDDYTRK